MNDVVRPTTPFLLADINNRLAVIEARLEIIADHESRIRDLEKARYQSAIIISLMSTLLTAGLVTFITQAI
jgi:hypothetical protein